MLGMFFLGLFIGWLLGWVSVAILFHSAEESEIDDLFQPLPGASDEHAALRRSLGIPTAEELAEKAKRPDINIVKGFDNDD